MRRPGQQHGHHGPDAAEDEAPPGTQDNPRWLPQQSLERSWLRGAVRPPRAGAAPELQRYHDDRAHIVQGGEQGMWQGRQRDADIALPRAGER